ncbi:hypothetical protein TNIN_155301 [Trichonephila inaurata madagascariensis]|uniref:Uncharacterized protein n=1 Tax=Trichonephila inaurata madagascariensis TaxID=2747483 RepID=A0A8X6X7V2_9ARAC|nr:hypothetical protein TNIN_227221 [Trichonephila inaurata madagascariensis]GFY75597.1 hypothetical protein TNIN_155301 [Trichonephila inaurata madagascariensis]
MSLADFLLQDHFVQKLKSCKLNCSFIPQDSGSKIRVHGKDKIHTCSDTHMLLIPGSVCTTSFMLERVTGTSYVLKDSVSLPDFGVDTSWKIKVGTSAIP